jgi:hypothetical protein
MIQLGAEPMKTSAERLQGIDSYLAAWVEPVFQKRTPETIDIFLNHRKKFEQNLLDAIKIAATAAEPLIATGEKQNITHLHFSYLLSAALMKELWLKIDLYDQRHYGDLAVAGSYWDYQALFPYIDVDMVQIRSELVKNFLRIKDHEILDFRLYYHVGVFALIEEILTEILTGEICQAALSELFPAEITVLFGGYLDHARVIATIRSRQAQ